MWFFSQTISSRPKYCCRCRRSIYPLAGCGFSDSVSNQSVDHFYFTRSSSSFQSIAHVEYIYLLKGERAWHSAYHFFPVCRVRHSHHLRAVTWPLLCLVALWRGRLYVMLYVRPASVFLHQSLSWKRTLFPTLWPSCRSKTPAKPEGKLPYRKELWGLQFPSRSAFFFYDISNVVAPPPPSFRKVGFLPNTPVGLLSVKGIRQEVINPQYRISCLTSYLCSIAWGRCLIGRGWTPTSA